MRKTKFPKISELEKEIDKKTKAENKLKEQYEKMKAEYSMMKGEHDKNIKNDPSA